MPTTQSIQFEVVRNGFRDVFPSCAWDIILFDGYPDLLHLNFKIGDVRVIGFRDGIRFDAIKLEKEYMRSNRYSCDGKKLCLLEDNRNNGIMLMCENGSFRTEEIILPSSASTPISFHSVNDMTYFVTATNSFLEYHVFSTNSSNPILSFTAANLRSTYCLFGNYLIVLSPSYTYTTIRMYDLNNRNFELSTTFEDVLKGFSPLEDRWLIIIGITQIGIIDVSTMKVDTFSYVGIVGNVGNCAARKRENLVEIFVSSTSTNYPGSCKIFKAYIPLGGLDETEAEEQISTVDEEIAALKLENREINEKVALLEATVSNIKEDKQEMKKSHDEKMNALEEKMTALEKKCTSMLLMMSKK